MSKKNDEQRESEEARIEREQKALNEEYEKLIQKIKEMPKADADKMLKDLIEKSGMTTEQFVEFQSKIKNGLPTDDIIATIASTALPIWLKTQVDSGAVPAGYQELEKFLDVNDYENGNVSFDYQDYTEGDGKKPYYAAMGADDVSDLWKEKKKREVAIESWMATRVWHKNVINFKPLFTASHKSALYFVLQFNRNVIQLGQSFLDYHMSLKGRYIWLGAKGDESIVENNDEVKFNPIEFKVDGEVKADNIYSLTYKLNKLIKDFHAPLRTHFDAYPARKAEFAIEGISRQLKRSLNKEYIVLAPAGFVDAYNIAFLNSKYHENLAKADILDHVQEVPFSIFKEEYANITGLKDGLAANAKDDVTGTTTILIMSGKPYKMIHQYFATERTNNLGNLTTIINVYRKMGFALDKKPTNFVLTLDLTIEKPTEPEPTEPEPTEPEPTEPEPTEPEPTEGEE